ncbi:MAG: hypothetical protein BGO37_17500 [Cellulomonas sp. 73-92]|nr:MAG: hypothetical protein BGO37_17500 [Cellulomonas sp. 73-92]
MGAMQGTQPEGQQRDRDAYVHVTDADVHAARDAWWRAQSEDPASERTATLHESYRQIVHAQAQQIAEEFRAAHAR